MKQKTRKTIAKRYKLSNPKRGVPKVEHDSQSFKKFSKKRKFRLFRSKAEREIGNKAQAAKIINELS